MLKKYEQSLINLLKFNMKVRPVHSPFCPENANAQGEIFRFLASAIKGNLNRLKLGSMIQGANKSMLNFATDNFSLILYDILMDFAKVIFTKPEFQSKIDKDFVFSIGDEFGYKDYSTIAVCKEHYSQPSNVGTITKFFFYVLEAFDKHFHPFVKNLMEFHQTFRRMEKSLKHAPPSDPRCRNQDYFCVLTLT